MVILILGRLLLLATEPVVAPSQDGSPGTSAPALDRAATRCELHLWPAARSIAAVEYNPIRAGRDRAFVGDGGDRPRPKMLSPEEQLSLLQQLDLSNLLRLPARATVVIHALPLDRSQAVEPVRHSNSTASCNGELIVNSIVYESTAMVARSLRVDVTFQLFADGQLAPVRRFNTSARARLRDFPAKNEAGVPAANYDLETAYRTAIKTFTDYAGKALVGPDRIMSKE